MKIISLETCQKKKKKQKKNIKEKDPETWKKKNKSKEYQAAKILIFCIV